MGIQGGWKLVGNQMRKCALEGLQGRRVAIDVSIWIVQFISGYMEGKVEKPHLRGLFFRICKLLHYGVKPVFIFDGKPPSIKRNTLQRRAQLRKQRELDVRVKYLMSLVPDPVEVPPSPPPPLSSIEAMFQDITPIPSYTPEVKKIVVKPGKRKNAPDLEDFSKSQVRRMVKGVKRIKKMVKEEEEWNSLSSEGESDIEESSSTHPEESEMDSIYLEMEDLEFSRVESSQSEVSVLVKELGVPEADDIDIPRQMISTVDHKYGKDNLGVFDSLASLQETLVECQQLFQLFGIPYLVSPGEAEAQCVYLCQKGIVDAVITEDSDVLALGCPLTFKNVFHRQKDMVAIRQVDIERQLKWGQDQFIFYALLMGCDYCDQAVEQIGRQTSKEIVDHFDTPATFKAFWEKGFQDTSLPSRTQKKLDRLRKTKSLPSAFPDEQVKQQFIEPVVNPSETPFTWKEVEYEALQSYCVYQLRIEDTVAGKTLRSLKEKREKLKGRTERNIETYFL